MRLVARDPNPLANDGGLWRPLPRQPGESTDLPADRYELVVLCTASVCERCFAVGPLDERRNRHVRPLSDHARLPDDAGKVPTCDTVYRKRQLPLQPVQPAVHGRWLSLCICEDRRFRHWGNLTQRCHECQGRGLHTSSKRQDIQHHFSSHSASPSGVTHPGSSSPATTQLRNPAASPSCPPLSATTFVTFGST